MQAPRKSVGTQANDNNMVTVMKTNYQQPVKTDLLATPLFNKENSGTDVQMCNHRTITPRPIKNMPPHVGKKSVVS